MGKDQDRRRTKIDWKTYNKKLVERGTKVAKHISNLKDHVTENWEIELKEKNAPKNGKSGSRYEYPDTLFILLYIIKAYNRFSYRTLKGQINCMFENAPSYSRTQERIKSLDPELIKKIDAAIVKAKLSGKKLKVVLDSTGFQINDSYVWLEEKHKQKKKRKWKKVHFAADIESGIIVGFTVHEYNESEVETQRLFQFMEQLLFRVKDIAVLEKLFGDGAYDNGAFFELLNGLGIKPVIKINKNTIDFIRQHLEYNMNKLMVRTPCALWKPENERQKEALKQVDWNKYVVDNGYGQRSAIEGDIGGFKGLFGGSLFSKLNNMICKEMAAKVLLWNVMR